MCIIGAERGTVHNWNHTIVIRYHIDINNQYLIKHKMILEAVNSVCLTYLATEFLLNNNDYNTTSVQYGTNLILLQSIKTFISHQSRPIQYTFVTIICINIPPGNYGTIFIEVGSLRWKGKNQLHPNYNFPLKSLQF